MRLRDGLLSVRFDPEATAVLEMSPLWRMRLLVDVQTVSEIRQRLQPYGQIREVAEFLEVSGHEVG